MESLQTLWMIFKAKSKSTPRKHSPIAVDPSCAASALRDLASQSRALAAGLDIQARTMTVS